MDTTVLFVCTGNTCRSPFAEHYARSLWQNHDIVVSSAGTEATPGIPATDTMVVVADSYGLDLSPHRARPLVPSESVDLVICMEQRHAEAARRTFPHLSDDAIRLLNPNGVPDPYGQPESYERTAEAIAGGIKEIPLG